MATPTSLARLKSQLLTSGLQQKDNALFQIINSLIDGLISTGFTADEAASSGGGGGSGSAITALTGDVTATGPGSVAATISNDAVTTPKIIDDAVTTDKIIDDAVTTPKVVDEAITYAKIQDVSATSRILARKSASSGPVEEATLSEVLDFIGSAAQGDILYRGAANWARLAAGTAGKFLSTNGAGADPSWNTVAGSTGAFYSGAGHPQGVQSAALGSYYVDTNNGYVYRKYGGGSTAYGWYYEVSRGLGSAYGPQTWVYNQLETVPIGTTGSTLGIGLLGGNTPNTQVITAKGNNWYREATGSNTSGTLTSIQTTLVSLAAPWYDYGFDLVTRIYSPAVITNMRYWFILTTAAITNADANGGHAIGFRYSTAVPDGGWVGYTRNSTGPTQNVTATVANIAADTFYILRIRFVRSGTPTVYFSVNDGTEVSVTGSSIPPTGVFPFVTLGVTPLANNAPKSIFSKTIVMQSGD
jgi:hypothetical protein